MIFCCNFAKFHLDIIVEVCNNMDIFTIIGLCDINWSKKAMMYDQSFVKRKISLNRLQTSAINTRNFIFSNDLFFCDMNKFDEQATRSEIKANKDKKHRKIYSLDKINIPYITHLHQASFFTNVFNKNIDWESYEMAKATLSNIKLQTLEDYFLFFASANLMNSYAKQLNARGQLVHSDYNFKGKVQEVVNNMCVDEEFLKNTHLTDNIKLDMHFDRDAKKSCVLVSVSGIQFGFHCVTQYGVVPEEIYQKFPISPKKNCAEAMFKFANNLDNLTAESIQTDEITKKPISLREVQNMAAYNFINKANCTRYSDVKYENPYPNFEIERCKQKYGTNPTETYENVANTYKIQANDHENDKEKIIKNIPNVENNKIKTNVIYNKNEIVINTIN